MAPSRQADNWNIFLWFQYLATHVLWSVSRPAEVQPWEVRSDHLCRARARHPIHKTMGGHTCLKETVPRKRFIRYNLTPNSHFVPDKTFKQDEIFCLTSRLLSFPRKARQECNYVNSPSAPRIRTLQQAPFADFAAEDLVQRLSLIHI